ncbi:MAG: GNAT family N-acetyltransferase [Pseudomonadota bacterium]
MTPVVPTEITTERLQLRLLAAADLDSYLAYYTGPRTDGVGGPKPKHVVIERFFAMAGQWVIRGFGRYAIALKGRAIGHAGVLHIDEVYAPEITWTIWDAAETGKGYATEAARAALGGYLAVRPRVLAHIESFNAASIRVAEKIGMRHDMDGPKHPWMKDSLCYVGEAR